MKVAFNITPLGSVHKNRGIGNYSLHLLNALKEIPNIEIYEFINSIEKKDIDVIHYPWFDLFFHTLPNLGKTPTIVTIHDVIPLKFKQYYPVGIKGKINLYFQKRALKKVNFIITDSYSSKKDIIELLKVDSKKIKVISLAADEQFKILPQSRLLRIKRKYSLGDKFILYVGDANWVKNLPFLIKSFSNLIKLPNMQDVSLVLVGGVFLKRVENINHPELESLKKVNSLIKEDDLEGRVKRVGQISTDELVCFYNLAEIYIQPSIYEGFGLPILEAMSCGVPVICSNGGSLPEVGGDAVVYFDPVNSKQFESIILEVLNNKSLHNKLSKLGLKQAEKFSWEKVAKQTVEVYSNVTNF